MTAKQLYNRLFELGDTYVFFTTSVSKKQKYHICTVDFNNCKYIKEKITDRDKVKPEEGFVRVFCWDLDSFKLVKASAVTKLLPLSVIVNQNA